MGHRWSPILYAAALLPVQGRFPQVHAWLETAQSWLSPRVPHKHAASGEGAHAHSVSVVFGGHRVVGTLCEAKLMETLMETLELIETFQAATPWRCPEDSSYSSN